MVTTQGSVGTPKPSLNNFPPPPAPASATSKKQAILVGNDYRVKGKLTKDALGRTVIEDDQQIVDPSREVHRKNARPVGLSAADNGEGGENVFQVEGTYEELKPKYMEGDQYQPANLPYAERIKLQREMVSAGLLGKKFKNFGVWDVETSTAYEKLLGYANQSAVDKDEILAQFKAVPNETEMLPGKVLTLANPDDIGKVLDQTAEKVINRSLTPAERTALIAGYQNVDRSAQEAAAAAESEAETSGLNKAVIEAPDVAVFADKKLREQFKGESDWVTGNKRMQEFYSILGEGGGMGLQRG